MTETDPIREHPHDAHAARVASYTGRFAELTRQRAALDAAEARLLAEAVAYAAATAALLVSATASPSEAEALARRSMCASLAMATRTAEPTLQHRIADAKALVHDAPTVLDALGHGTISAAHARIITDQLRDVPAEGRPVFLERVLPVAARSTPARLKQRARVLRERLHPESITARTVRSTGDRRVELEPAADGMAWLHLFTTAPVAQAILSRLDTLAIPARLEGDARTLAQLRADALASLAISATVSTDGAPIPADPETSAEVVWLPGSARPRGTVSVAPGTALIEHPTEVQAHIRATVQLTVPVLSLLGVTEEPGNLDGYGPIDPDTAARLAVTAPTMTRILTHPETGAILSVGREQYRVPAELQRAVRLRDTTCRAPGCGRRARRCDLDHTTAWQHGGTTAVDNLACLCRHHHRLKHQPGWQLEQGHAGTLNWTTPDGRQYETRPELVETG